jgi:hypothetical protein
VSLRSQCAKKKLSNGDELPQRFIAGADAIGTAEQKVALLQQQIDAHRELSSSLAFDGLPAPKTRSPS